MDQRLPSVEELSRSLAPIFRRYGVRRALVFGSVARGEVTRHSDVDILAVMETDLRFFDRYEGILADVVRAVSAMQVDLLLYTPEELERISHRRFIRRALEEGKVIYESDQSAA